MAWLNYNERVDSLSTMDNEVGVTRPESTIQTLPLFEVYTPPVTYPEEVGKTLGTLIDVEPLNETKLEEVGLNCNHNTPFSSREVPSFDKLEPQPQPLPNCPPLDASLGTERGLKPPIKPQSPDSFRIKNTLAEYMILSGADNHPPMLDKDLYDSWKSRMELYMQNREHRKMILESVENGSLIWPTIKENGVTRTKEYAELSAAEKIQADCDMKETNIIFQGLPADIYVRNKMHKAFPLLVRSSHCQKKFSQLVRKVPPAEEKRCHC
nr:hypothetical protein [Tanacetum cinerariifolium]